MNKTVIMLSGYKDSGKDTTSNIISHLTLQHYLSIEYYAFATPIKQIASVMFNIPFSVMDGKTPEDRRQREAVDEFWAQHIPDFTPRKSLTMLGTDILRQYVHDDIWILKAQRYIKDSNANLIIITDLREPNEESKMESFCEKEGFECIHINILRETPTWIDIAKNAYFNESEEALEQLKEINVHPSEWKQVGLTPDFQVLNNEDDYFTTISQQLKRFNIV